MYCLHHFKGDEKAISLIHDLIDPSVEAPGKPSGERGSSPNLVYTSECICLLYVVAAQKLSPFAFTEDDYLALLAKDPLSLFTEDSYMKHLRKHANRIVLRVRQLQLIRWDMLGEHLDKIKQGIPAK